MQRLLPANWKGKGSGSVWISKWWIRYILAVRGIRNGWKGEGLGMRGAEGCELVGGMAFWRGGAEGRVRGWREFVILKVPTIEVEDAVMVVYLWTLRSFSE